MSILPERGFPARPAPMLPVPTHPSPRYLAGAPMHLPSSPPVFLEGLAVGTHERPCGPPPGAALWCCGGRGSPSPRPPPPERIMTWVLPPDSWRLDPAAPSFAPSSVPGDTLLPQDPTHIHRGAPSRIRFTGPPLGPWLGEGPATWQGHTVGIRAGVSPSGAQDRVF